MSRVRERPGRWRGQGPRLFARKPNYSVLAVKNEHFLTVQSGPGAAAPGSPGDDKNGSLLSVQGGPGAAAPGSPGDWRGVWELVGEARLGYRKESFCLAWWKEGVSLRLILERLRTHPWGV